MISSGVSVEAIWDARELGKLIKGYIETLNERQRYQELTAVLPINAKKAAALGRQLFTAQGRSVCQ